jgi:adenine-specific DNA methylase
MSFDAILVCRERRDHAHSLWKAVEGEIRDRTHQALDALQPSGDGLSALDRYVVVLGKCLECYTRFYPDVFDGDGSAVPVEEAIARMEMLSEAILDDRQPAGVVGAARRMVWGHGEAQAGGGEWARG